jgi:hypothetical protein
MYIDKNKVILSGENSFIRLSETDDGPVTTSASLWHILFSPAGPGHVLYLKSELNGDAWKLYTDNIAMARWMQKTVQGMLNPELKDLSIPAVEATFTRNGDFRDFWTERVHAVDGEITLTWHEIGDPLLLNMPPWVTTERPYGVSTVLIPTLAASVSRAGISAKGQPWPREREGRPYSTACLAFAESWTESR